MCCPETFVGYFDNMYKFTCHMINAKAEVSPAFTIASAILNWCCANCGTEDKMPNSRELAQIIAGEIFTCVGLINSNVVSL